MQPETLERKLEQRALREGWDIPAGERERVIAKTIARATCGDPDIEEAATRTLIAVDALELKRAEIERKRLEAEHARKLQLIEAAVKLGLVVDAGGSSGAIPSQPSSSVG